MGADGEENLIVLCRGCHHWLLSGRHEGECTYSISQLRNLEFRYRKSRYISYLEAWHLLAGAPSEHPEKE